MKTRLLILWPLLASLAVAQPDLTSNRVSLSTCEVDAASGNGKEKALCGSYDVYEDRSARSGRKIPIKIVVFPATSSTKEPDPLFYIPGGPGSSATEDAPYIAQELARIRERRDLVFVDQRGTGGSNLLFCDFFDPKNVQSYLATRFGRAVLEYFILGATGVLGESRKVTGLESNSASGHASRRGRNRGTCADSPEHQRRW